MPLVSPHRSASPARRPLLWLATAVLAFSPLLSPAQVSIPIPNILAEVEHNLNNRQYANAADLLDRVITRMEAGEAMPSDTIPERLRLTAATSHYQNQNFVRAAQVAEALIATNPPAAILGETHMLLGLSYALQQKYAEAIAPFRAAESSLTHRDKAMLYGAISAQQAGQIPVAIDNYNRLLAASEPNNDWADAALSLVALHVQQNNVPAASRALGFLRRNLDLVDNIAGLNVLSLQLGDALLQSGDAAGALNAYRSVYQKHDIIREQTLRNTRMERQIARAQALTRGDALQMDSIRRLSSRLELAKAALSEIEKLENYDATLLYRLGHAFQERGGVWEAALIFEDLITNHPGTPERERAYFGLVRAYSTAGRLEKTRDAADRFARAYPDSEFGAQSLYLAAMAAGQRGETAIQLSFLQTGIDRFPRSELREPMLLMSANARFASFEFDLVRLTALDYLREFPEGRFIQEAAYLAAMAALADGQATLAAREIETYLEKHPDGTFVADARYRLAATSFARQDFDQASERASSWLRDYPPEHHQRGEVLSLQGDVFLALDRPAEAINSFRQALDLPLSDEQLGYILDELTRLYQTRRENDAAVAMWENFVQDNPDHPYVINAAYWIGRIRSREGRTDEAIDRVGEIARRYVTDPSRDAVERLLVELAGMSARPPRAPRGQPRPEAPSEEELFQRIDRLLLTGDARRSPTAQARALFTKAEIASIRKNDRLVGELLDRIAAQHTPDTLPPGILGKVGDHLLAKNELELAKSFYSQIVSTHGRTIFADFGYTGLGEIALRENDPQIALQHFNNAIDLAGARFKLREATLGQAKALLALNRLDDARKMFEDVASNRAWRGEATAESIFSLGEIHMRRGTNDDIALAQAHFQRVYISYRRFIPWVAKAYLRSTDAFEQLGQTQEAVNTLREMLRDDRLRDLPEYNQARTRLSALENRVASAPRS